MKIISEELNNDISSVDTLITNAKLTDSINNTEPVGKNIITTGEINLLQIAINQLEKAFSENCCQSINLNCCQNECTSKNCNYTCQSCQTTVSTCQACQKSTCQTCQSCQKNC